MSNPRGRTSLEKEPYFDKRLNRSVDVVKGEVMVRFKKGLAEAEVTELIKQIGATVVRKNEQLGTYRLRIPQNANVSGFIDQHATNTTLGLIEPNFIVKTLAATKAKPNDPLFPSQWGLSKIQVEKAWEVTTGSPEVVVAIIDSGIELTHEDLKNQLVAGYDFVNQDDDPSDDNGHGTHVAGIVGAEGNNGLGIIGIAWGCRLMPVKVINEAGEGAYSDLVEGILYAADHAGRVLNLSIGGYSWSQILDEAVEYAHGKGAVIVAAAGNDNVTDPAYPAACPNVIAVSAIESADQPWPYSNRGSHVRLSAPGTDIVSATPGNSYVRASGTSASAALVAGAAALVLSHNIDLSNTLLEETLFQTADDLGASGRDQVFGFGRLNVFTTLEQTHMQVHDLAVTRIRIQPHAFTFGEQVSVIVTVQNQGTFAEQDVKLRLTVNGSPIDASIPINSIEPGETNDVTFIWISQVQTNQIVELLAQVETENDADLDDNVKKARLRTVWNQQGIATFYRVAPPVHQWIALQAFNKLSANSELRLEMKTTFPQTPIQVGTPER